MKLINDESGYILLLVMVVICVITLSIALLSNQAVSSSFFAARRSSTVQSFSLAESAALEGYWYLRRNPSYRTGQSRYWGMEWYRFTIIDNSPLTTNDLNLEILGEGTANGKLRRVRLRLSRPDINSTFQVASWSEEN